MPRCGCGRNGCRLRGCRQSGIESSCSLPITLHEVYLALAKTPIEGPAGVEGSFEFRAAFNATATRMMTAVLRNQQAGTEYA